MLTVKDAAARAGVSDSLIYAWCADGTLPHVRVGRKGRRGHIRIDAADLDAALESLKVTGGRATTIVTPPPKGPFAFLTPP